MKHFFYIVLMLSLLAACQPQPNPLPDAAAPSATPEPIRIASPDNPYAPSQDDAQLAKGPVTFNSIGLLVMTDYPDQIALSLDGSLPSPCHQLRLRVLPVSPGSGRVDVEAYSVVNREQVCQPVLKLFNENVPIGRFPPGLYELYLNGALIGTFNGG